MRPASIDLCLDPRQLLAVAFVVCLMPLSAHADEVPRQTRKWDFESDSAGSAPAGFRSSVGKWTVALDGQNHVLAQTAQNEDAMFNVILEPDVLFSDVEISVRLKAVKGVVDQGGGIIWRAKNARTYYISRYNPLEDSFRVYKVVDGKRSQLASTKAPGDMNWHTIRVVAKGSRIECSLDDTVRLELEDRSIRGFGRVGLWTKSDSQSYFDDLVATGEAFVPQHVAFPSQTKQFEIRDDRPFLGGHEVNLWGLRCGNAFVSDTVTERYLRNFDNMNAHGINFVGAYLQGVNAGFPNGDAGLNGFTRHGKLLPEVARRAERFIREADKRGMVVMIGIITPRKDQEFYDDAAIRTAIEETARFLTGKKLRNVFVNLCDEFNDPVHADKLLLREPDGAKKKELMTRWFKGIAPHIPAGVGPYWKSGTADSYPSMDVRIIQKGMPIPKQGFVVNVEPICEDYYQNDGIFNKTNLDAIFTNCRNYLDAPHAAFLFHSAFVQGITNYSGTAPHGEMGGYGTGPTDRGIRFYYDWVRDNVGSWQYPRHIPTAEFTITPQPIDPTEEP
jgi:hypothetical protein